MTTANRAHDPANHLDQSTTWLDLSADFGRERAQLLAVDGQSSRNAQIAEANNQQSHALKLAEIHALLAIASGLAALGDLARPSTTVIYDGPLCDA